MLSLITIVLLGVATISCCEVKRRSEKPLNEIGEREIAFYD